ncbi:MAG: PAS domain-containing protein [Fimbriimonas sp.]
MRASLHRNESERLAALRAYGVLDTPRERDFDEIVALVAQICGTPIAVVNLVDEERQWFKAEIGLGVRETPLDTSLCAHAILERDLVEIPDTLLDPRFQTNPLVTGTPHLRFYAGALLESPDGLPIGTLCVLDHAPRQLTDLQRQALRVFARQVMTQLEVRRQARSLAEQQRAERRTLKMAQVGTWAWDIVNDRVFGNPLLEDVFGVEDATGTTPLATFLNAVHPEDRPSVVDAIQSSITSGRPYDIEYRVGSGDAIHWVLARGNPLQAEGGKTTWLSGVIVDITARRAAEAERERLLSEIETEREKLWAILANSPAFAAVLVGRDLVYEYANPIYYQTVGHRPIVGLPLLEAVPEIAGQGFVERLHAVMDTGEPMAMTEVPCRLQREPDGPAEDRFLTLNFYPIRAADGTISGVLAHGIDVTDHVLIRGQLDAERHQFRTLLDEVPAHVVTLRGPDLVYEFANREFIKFVGRDDFLGLRAEEAWPVPDEHLALLHHILATGEPFVGREAPVQSPPLPGVEPTVGLFDFVFQPLREADGTVSGVFVHSLDVTEKVNARQELSAQAEQLRTIFDRAEDDAMILMDADRKVLAWNRGAERICGWTAEDAVGNTADVIFTREDREAGAPQWEAETAARDGKATDERWHQRRDGSRFWGSGTITALHYTDESIRGFLKVFRDATEKRRETETLAFLRDLTDAVMGLRARGAILSVAQRMIGEHLQATGCVYYELAADGEMLTIVRDWAAGLPSITGTYPVDTFGSLVAASIREGRLLTVHDVANEIPSDAGGRVIERLGIRALVCAPLAREGRVVAGFAVNSSTPREWAAHEIELVRIAADRVWSEVERARAEEALRKLNEELEAKVEERTEELEASIKEAEGFNYSIAHDLRAPLRAIIATSKILEEEIGGELKPEYLHLLHRQAHNASRLGVLIDQLLSLSRLARVEVQRGPFNMTTLANDIAAELERAGMTNGCRIEVAERMEADGDARLVRMALTNLLENACKFSSKGGSIEVGSHVVDNERIFFVRDEGIGFDMRYVHKLFLPFERLVLESDLPGTGIGLANVERVIRRHGGRVWAHGELGKGATFSFTLGR